MAWRSSNALARQWEPRRSISQGRADHIEAVIPTQVVLNERRHVGRLVFFEICAYITEHFPQIQAISFAFRRPIDALGRPAGQAASRATAMERIGVVNITVTPVTTGVHVVSGVWPYSEANRVALQTALEEQRAIFRDKPIVRPSFARKFLAKLAAFLSRSTRGSK